MNDFSKFNKIREGVSRSSDSITNVLEVSNDSGFRCLHILWLYPDVMHIHGGRGDVMGILHISNLMDIPVEIKRWDSLKKDIDWTWPHLVYMNAGELKCCPDVIKALKRQSADIEEYVARGGSFVANGSSGAVLADSVTLYDGRKVNGLGLLHMDWKERESVWGDDIWIKTADNMDVIGNQIQVADVTLAEGQEAFGSLIYGRGNNGSAEAGGSGEEGARSGNVIYTGVLGPLLTKNPLLTAELLKNAGKMAGIQVSGKIKEEDIEVETRSSEYIKNFMKNKMK